MEVMLSRRGQCFFGFLFLLIILVASSFAESNRIRLGLLTAVPQKWELEQNWLTFERIFMAHRNQEIDLVVTPECFLDGYAASSKDWTQARFEQIAQDIESSSYIRRLRSLAKEHKTAILFGFTEACRGKYYNCALLVDKAGEVLGHYHKTHLQAHDLRFSAGDSLPVFATEWGKLGVLICADRRWPEAARVLRLKGSRILLIPSYGMSHLDNEWWMRTRSYENECFLAFVHPLVAFVSDPNGQVLAKLQTNVPDMLVCDVDLSQVHENNQLRDRRPDLYREIVSPR